ncbi:phospholipid-transporting ATPase ABCA1-like [Argiope bruennichi]|uniref:phospholipid-transporting ATPase ABCA1-like n=1 Tax=Argiope bruennichi TaxID=94029 RepID=UPI002494052D|nr:phospholipid-transporting ATPase ABCA1-like [Argiope bruennichi]
MPASAWNNSQAQPSKAHGSSSMRKFLILLYKGFLLRKRHYLVTFFEIVIPIFIAAVPVIIQSESSPYDVAHNRIDDRSTGSRWSNITTYEPFDPLKSREGQYFKIEFLYTPSKPLAERFINDSIELFQKSTNHKGEIISRGMDTEEQMESYTLYKKENDNQAAFIGTVLHGFDDKLPAYLDYKIRYSEKNWFFDAFSFETSRKYRMNGPHDKNDYTSSYFIPWQTAVEETFIQRKMEEHKKHFDYKVWMQQFPYPEHKEGQAKFDAKTIASWVICYGHLIFVINIIRRIVEEKSNGSKELLKMMGMTNCTYWTSTFMNYFIIGLINALVIAILYKSPMKNAIVFVKHSNFLILFLFLLLFLISLILFCMVCSIFFNRAVFAIIALLVIYNTSFTTLMSQYFFLNTEDYFALSVGSKLGICLLPTGALLTGFQIIIVYEASAEGVQWNNMDELTLIPDMSMSMTLGMMLVSCVLYIFAIWYLDAVWPWQPGVPKPFYFLFTRSYWCGNKADSEEDLQLLGKPNNSEFFEEDPTNIYAGVVIKNLFKEFRSGLTSKLAVKDVSLNIYQGQITALLGHNGAGKTTTINILTGLYTPTSGTASINGFDILKDTAEARGGFGVCPQHNVLYDTLTVEEHLRMYAAMKGVQWSQLTNEATQVLNILKLADKRHELVKNLSGGMKRKLSLGIAIVGGSKVLFLDEPTSGMDVEARRGVWDALLEIRRDRTVILTTHYMEEADILGDRIAIMADGQIQCCGSPMFLKQKFGTGYHLHVVKDQYFNMQGLVFLLQKYVPDVTVENELEKDISFRLPTATGKEFADMFEELESQKSKLGVISFGITITTMEDVFLNVSNISDVNSKLQSGKLNQNINEQLEDVYGDSAKVRPQPRLVNQFMALLIKRFHYAKRHWGILTAQIIIPFLIMCLCFINLKSAQLKKDIDPLKLDISSVYGKTQGFYYREEAGLANFSDTFRNVLETNQVEVQKVPEPTHYVLDYGTKNLAKYLKTFLVGGAIDKDQNETNTINMTAWFNGEPYHAPPMSLLLMHTAILKSISDDGGITLVNAPLPQSTSRSEQLSEIIKTLARILAAVFVPMAFSSLSAGFVLVPIHERATKAKLLQLMSGVPATIYWIAMFVWDYLMYFIVCILMIIPYGIFANYVFFGERSEAIGTALLLMLFHGWASIPFSYLLSFWFQRGNAGFAAVVGICIFVGTALGSTLTAVKIAFPASGIVSFFMWVFRFLPPFSLSSGFANLFAVAYPNAFCESIPKKDLDFNCDPANLDISNPLFKCCKKACGENCLKAVYPITWEDIGCGRELFALALSGFIYFGILFLKETPYWAYFFRALRYRLRRLKKQAAPLFIRQESVIEDTEVIQEEERIRNMTATRYGSGEEALLVSDLSKEFNNFYAVNKLSFGIRQEECFGLLGVNGAGKTTTFRMLTGDCEPTSGNAFIQNSSLLTDLKTFQSYLGYCPQFDALIDRLTGREMLMLFGQLRGLTGYSLLQMVDKLIKMTDLIKHADKQTQFYSGGNKRKLSVAIALIGSPPLILLDEPTAGVDPVSRRKIWSILSQARNNTGAAVLLTTHSMEESEALCNRLAIMVNGRFRCLGSIQQLKSKYGQGYTLIIKVKREDQENIEKIEAIKSHIQTNLQGANLKDDHQGMLQYHIVNPSITLSYLFKFMSEMKTQFELEDYLISDTSLEQIFLTFARAQRVTGQ